MIRRVLALALAFGVVASATVKADAYARRHHHRYHHFARSSYRSRSAHVGHEHAGFSLVTVPSAAGSITVNAAYASKFVGAIADLFAAGFRGPVHCYARGGHVRHSLHYTGEACDFAQLGRNRVASGAGIMYHAHAILSHWGLRDGCTFHDCGHADTGRTFATLTRRHYAETRHRRYVDAGERRPAENTKSVEPWALNEPTPSKLRYRDHNKADKSWDDWNGRNDWSASTDWNEPRHVAEYRHSSHHRYR
jgi:hypothetical protein